MVPAILWNRVEEKRGNGFYLDPTFQFVQWRKSGFVAIPSSPDVLTGKLSHPTHFEMSRSSNPKVPRPTQT